MSDVNISHIRSITRAIDILQCFSINRPALSIEEITKITELPKSTVYRILVTLKSRDFVQFNEKTLEYTPGLRLMEFGFLLPVVLNVQSQAEEILINLFHKTKQTVLLAIPEDEYISYIFKKENQEGLKYSSSVGHKKPYIYGVLGPAMLAFMPEDEIDRILSMPINRRTAFTVTDKGILKDRLQQIRQVGYYIESDETNVGVTGIGAPILGMKGEPIAGFGVIGPSVQINPELDQLIPLVLEASRAISIRMGYNG